MRVVPAGPRPGRRRLRRWTPALLLVLVGPARADLVLNEFLPDPEGSDAGREFVELFNPDAAAVSLAGVTLEFANGAVGPEWEVRWRGEAGQLLAAGGRFLIVDRNWAGLEPADVEVTLALQNGPDALRLVREGSVLDLVGYGALTDPLLLEGTPVAVVVGMALARRPDGRDSGDNGADFVAAVPTPGRPNFLPWSLRREDLALEPPSLDRPGGSLQVTAVLLNDGIETLPTGSLQLTAGAAAAVALLDRCPAGERRTVTWFLAPPATGRLALAARYPVPGLGDTLVLDLGACQVGPADLVLNEVLAAPDAGQGEWIEVRAGPAGADLGGYRLRDEGGPWRALPAVFLGPLERAVLAQDPAALAGWSAANAAGGLPEDCVPGALLALAGGWPALNNTADAAVPFADRLQLADSTGTVVDHLAWDGGDPAAVPAPPAGVSLERRAWSPPNPGAANWAPATAAAGATCGCPNSVAAPAGPTAGLAAVPRILDPQAGPGVIHLRFRLQPPAVGWELRIFDLWGGLVRDLGGERRGPGPRDLLWDGRDDGGRPVVAGGYLVLLVARDAGERALYRSTLLVAVRRQG